MKEESDYVRGERREERKYKEETLEDFMSSFRPSIETFTYGSDTPPLSFPGQAHEYVVDSNLRERREKRNLQVLLLYQEGFQLLPTRLKPLWKLTKKLPNKSIPSLKFG